VLESTAAVDTTDATRIGGAPGTGDIAEAVTVTDVPAALFVTAASLTEAVTAGDTPVVAAVQAASLSEAVTANDTVAALRSVDTTLTESVTATDVPAAVFTTAASRSEAVTVTDGPLASFVTSSSLSEAVTANDNVTGLRVVDVALSEAVTATDNAACTASGGASCSEPVNAADALTGLASLQASVTEAVAASDTTDASSVPSGAAVIVEAVNANDTVDATVVAATVPVEQPGHGGGVTVAYRRRWYEYAKEQKKRRVWRPGEGTLEEILKGVYEAEDEVRKPEPDLEAAARTLAVSREAAEDLEDRAARAAILKALDTSQRAIAARFDQAGERIAQTVQEFQAVQDAVMMAALEWERREQDDLTVLLLCA
jgi:hypothetical protein